MSARAHPARGYRMKAGPRRGGRGASRIHWDKLGRVVLVFVLFAILASYVNPVVNAVDAWRDARAERSELVQLKDENAELRDRAANLEATDAAERAARRLGMVAPGERPYSVK